MKKVLLLGSGALKIGEAGEFDYSGSQAIKALKEEGISVILVNPNIATIQTSEGMADDVYFVPVTADFVSRIIEKERPDGILLSFGGQTALNCGLELRNTGVLEKFNVQVLGTSVEAIEATEDRAIFTEKMKESHALVARGKTVSTVDDACAFGKEIGFPVMVRAGFALGGTGSGVVANEKELRTLSNRALSLTPQIIVEESLKGWKEIEYEVVRDVDDNCIVVCTVENMDAVGIHTGDSIVVSPCQTLSDEEYYGLRAQSIAIIRNLGIIGECNIQFALNPKTGDVRVIEVNARLSRSSALASKATGYPLAYVAAKLALGKKLYEIPNSITGKTTAAFEPALDYIVVKVPRWDLDKFDKVDITIGSEMKSVGEVMSIGRTFPEAIQKACRMLNDGYEGVIDSRFGNESTAVLKELLKIPTSMRLFTICSALRQGISVDEIKAITNIDPWFICHLSEIVQGYEQIRAESVLTREFLTTIKKLGFSDKQIADIRQETESDVRSLRLTLGITPFVHQIDTMAGEFPAVTNYLYCTYHAASSEYIPETQRDSVIVLGCGPYAIGTSVEFDWSAVNAVIALKKSGKRAIVINCNPETVSTDYDISDTLYFDELTLERVLDIFALEKSPILVSVGGQVSNNLAPKLERAGATLFGITATTINQSEDRNLFSHLLDQLDIPQPKWSKVTHKEETITIAKTLGYPLMVRPSFVLSGKAMSILETEADLERYLSLYPMDLSDYPLVLSQFLRGAKECDVDGVAQNGAILVSFISEHIEEAGVHSGDSSLLLPPVKMTKEVQENVNTYTKEIVRKMKLSGPFNIQFLLFQDKQFVIECNTRASRSFPFVSKATGINLIQCAIDVFLGKFPGRQTVSLPYTTVKVPQFSFQKLKGADPIPRVEMSSTGEVAAMGNTVSEAFLTAMLASGMKLPVKKSVLLSIGGDNEKKRFLEIAQHFADMKFTIYATSGTTQFLHEHNIAATRVGKIYEGIHPTVEDLLLKRTVDFAIIISEKEKGFSPTSDMVSDGYVIRRLSVDRGIPLLTNTSRSKYLAEALLEFHNSVLPIQPWSYYKQQRGGV